MAKEHKRWKIGNIGNIVGPQQLKWQQIGNTIGNNRQHLWNRVARSVIGVAPKMKQAVIKGKLIREVALEIDGSVD